MGLAAGAERLQWRIADLLVHGWDLVQATGVAVELPGDLVEQALTFGRAQLPSQPRTGRFADPQPIRDDAPAPPCVASSASASELAPSLTCLFFDVWLKGWGCEAAL